MRYLAALIRHWKVFAAAFGFAGMFGYSYVYAAARFWGVEWTVGKASAPPLYPLRWNPEWIIWAEKYVEPVILLFMLLLTVALLFAHVRESIKRIA